MKRLVALLVPALFSAVPAASLSAQAAAPAAKAEDVASVDAVIKTLYDVISGPAGQKRDWNRFRSIFAPGARLIPTGRDAAGKARIAAVWSPDEYANTVGSRLEEGGFFETEIGRTMEQYGNIVQVFSAYDSKRTAADPKPFARGINSIQLFNDGTRWWIVSIFWEGETPSNPIPAKYLHAGKH
ncbi:MAG: hypothetical protein JNJ80_16140 [Gemmatimonadetes bacterium]|nr:hypothetical protein [Gemmatimonadota bacterium]